MIDLACDQLPPRVSGHTQAAYAARLGVEQHFVVVGAVEVERTHERAPQRFPLGFLAWLALFPREADQVSAGVDVPAADAAESHAGIFEEQLGGHVRPLS